MRRSKRNCCFLKNWYLKVFQRSLFFLRITTLLTWLKSTLLLKNKRFDTTIYMKTQCLQTNKKQNYWKGKCLRSKGWSRERIALIKSLIYVRWKETHLRRGCQIELKMSADKCQKVFKAKNNLTKKVLNCFLLNYFLNFKFGHYFKIVSKLIFEKNRVVCFIKIKAELES